MKDLDREILELFGEAAHTRGHVRSEPGRKMGSRPFDFGELSTDRLHSSTKAQKRAEAREFMRYYLRKWKAEVKADPVRAERFRRMACAYARKAWPRVKADPKRHANVCASKRAFYYRHREKIAADRRANYDPAARRRQRQALFADAEKRARDRELSRVRNKRYQAKLKTDPTRYAKFLARCAKDNNRKYHRKARAAGVPQARCGACGQRGHNRLTCGR
jgi:hypothetical protein